MKLRTSETISQVSPVGNFWVYPGRFVTKLRRTYGDLFRLLTPRGPLVCAIGLDANRAFLVENDEKLSYGSGWDHVAPAIAEMGRGIVFMDGPDHRWFRRVLQPAFSPAAVAAHVPLMHEIVRARLATWPRSGTLALYGEINAMAFDITAALVIGERDEGELRRLNAVFRRLTLREKLLDTVAEMRGLLVEHMLPLIRARMQAPADDVLSRMIRAGQAEGRILSEDELFAQVNTLLVAGHFTAAGLCSYLLIGLHNHPYTARLRQEQLAHDDPDMETFDAMPLLDHTVMEAGRVISPVPHLPRGFATELEFRDCVFRPGDKLVCSVAGTHMDETIFPDPETVDPDRFAPPRNEHKQDAVALAPFGAGPRRCIGALMAEVMIKIMVHHVVRDFAIQPLAEAYAPPVAMPILRPMNGIPVRVQALRS
jgi:cytochrome P450